MHFPPKQFFSKKRQLHPIIWIKSITENWKLKIFMHFFTCLTPFKVLLYNALCEMEPPRKFEFFPNFHYKPILFSSAQLQLMSPPSTFLIFELYQHDVSQKNTFFIENSDSEEKSIVLYWKNRKNLNFLNSFISHRCFM